MDNRKIPISKAKEFAEQFNYDIDQIVILAWSKDTNTTRIVTWGKTKADCKAAAKAQEFWDGTYKENIFPKSHKQNRNIS